MSLAKLTANKRMQPDHPSRYANVLAADARCYKAVTRA